MLAAQTQRLYSKQYGRKGGGHTGPDYGSHGYETVVFYVPASLADKGLSDEGNSKTWTGINMGITAKTGHVQRQLSNAVSVAFMKKKI